MTLRRCDVVGLGENSVDIVYRVAGEIAANAKLPIVERQRLPGGQVATTLCTAASFGLTTRYLGSFGDDGNGRLIRGELSRRGVDTESARVRHAPNRYAVILVDGSGNRTVLWHRDAALAISPGDVDRGAVTSARLLHVDNVDEEAAITAAGMARSGGMQVTTDIDRVGDRTAVLVAAATLPVFAEHVPAALTGEPDPERALRAIRQRHDGMLCVTLGPRGAMLLEGDRLHRTGGIAVEAVDTTGAGDVFRGALIAALLRGDDPATMLRFATAAAAASCTKVGAIGGVPTAADVERFLARAAAGPTA